MNKWIIAILLWTASIASSQTWIPIGTIESTTIYVMKNSFVIGKNAIDEPYVLVKGKIEGPGMNAEEQWYVTLSVCATGAGRLVTRSDEGIYQYGTDITFNDETVASAIGMVICYFYEKHMVKDLT